MILAWGLITLNVWITLWGLTTTMAAKLWTYDRMVWLTSDARRNEFRRNRGTLVIDGSGLAAFNHLPIDHNFLENIGIAVSQSDIQGYVTSCLDADCFL